MLFLFLVFLPSHSSTYLYIDEFDLLSSPRIFAITLNVYCFFLRVYV